jgi:hypothetical protein
MYDNQYDREIIQATGITIKTQNRLLFNEYCQLMVHYCISKKNCLVLISEVIELALERINLVLKCTNSDLK